MTHQYAERITFENEDLQMFSEPLEALFSEDNPRPRFTAMSSACYRGYIGTWEIDHDTLFLNGLDGCLIRDIGHGTSAEKQCTLKDIFPDSEGPIPAYWFSGDLRIVKGECLDYVHAGYNSVYETEIFLTVRDGRITGMQTVDNTACGPSC